MASSSKSASTSASASAGDGNTCYPYQVFLNHRGADGKIFASNLYNHLTGLGLEVFLDTDEMEKGEGITDQLKGAIRTASVNIAIFSPKYCESYWCLDELLLMLECMLEKGKKKESGSIILPIFLHVTPSEVRWAKEGKGRYAEALKSLENKRTSDDQPRYDAEIIRKWKDALHDVADISGFELDDKQYNGDETKLLTDVVDKVLKLVPKYLYVSKYPTGLEDKLRDIEERVSLQQNETRKVKIVGIVGLGGIGKTTLAKQFYNLKKKEYLRSSFVSDVRENDSRRQLDNLQRKLIKDLGRKDRDTDSTDEGIPLLEKLLPHYHALIILDDVNCIEQLDALLPVLPAKDSLILVTSRDRKVLEDWEIEDTFIYTLEGLSEQHSVELFCMHAFHQRSPVPGFEKLVNKFVDACGRLPLALAVFGALVHGEKKHEHWKEHLLKLCKIPHEKIQKRLEISYESLDDEEKMIFLDVACFFVGEEKDIAMRIWEASGWQVSIGLQSLEKKHLVEVKEQTLWTDKTVECITMHDQLRDMGRYLADKEPSRRRIWSVTENLSEVQSHVGGIKNSAERDRQVHDLRWRQPSGKGSCVERVFNVEQPPQPPQLILLRCYNCPDSSFPPNISTENLRFLHIQGSNLETLWQLQSKAPRELRELYIAGSLTKIPESIGQLRLLEKVVLRSESILRSDDELMSFETLPDEFCQLQSLKHLELRQKCLKSLPDSFGDLSSLQHVNLARCTCLEMLPGSFVNLAKLLHIDLSHCEELQLLPDSFGNLTNLQHLDLSGCTKLKTLPNTFGNLIQLQFLSLGECLRLTIPSEVLGNITTLEHLDLSGLYELPAQFTCPRFLQSLKLSCSELPSDIGKLSNLKDLFIHSSELEMLPPSFRDLRSLEDLAFWACPFKCFPDSIRMLTQLKSLALIRMDLQQLKITEWFSGLPTTLETLAITGDETLETEEMEEMEELTGIERLKSLKNLHISECYELKNLYISECFELKNLYISECFELKNLYISECYELKNLYISECFELKRIHGLAQLTNLQQLEVSVCSELEELPGIEGSQSLKKVKAFGCPKLKREYKSSIKNFESYNIEEFAHS